MKSGSDSESAVRTTEGVSRPAIWSTNPLDIPDITANEVGGKGYRYQSNKTDCIYIRKCGCC